MNNYYTPNYPEPITAFKKKKVAKKLTKEELLEKTKEEIENGRQKTL